MHADRSASTPLPLNLAAAALGAVATGVTIFVLGRASETFQQHLALVLVAVAIAAMGIWFAPGARGAARLWAIGGIVATLVVAMAAGGALSRPAQVSEQVITADVVAPGVAPATGDAMAKTDAMGPADAMAKEAAMAKPARDAMTKDAPAAGQNVLVAQGRFEPLEHPGEGTASIIRTADGRHVLTLTGFSTDAGPDLDVRLVAGDPKTDSDVEAGRSIRLAGLKGSSGDQQYVLPDGVDPAEFTHAYVWCRAFSVGFTRARLA